MIINSAVLLALPLHLCVSSDIYSYFLPILFTEFVEHSKAGQMLSSSKAK